MAWWLWLIIGALGGFAAGAIWAFITTMLYIGKGMWG